MACVVKVSDICAPGHLNQGTVAPTSSLFMFNVPLPTLTGREGSVPLSGMVRTAALLEVPSEASRMQGCPVGPYPSAEPLGELVGLRKLECGSGGVPVTGHRKSVPCQPQSAVGLWCSCQECSETGSCGPCVCGDTFDQ